MQINVEWRVNIGTTLTRSKFDMFSLPVYGFDFSLIRVQIR